MAPRVHTVAGAEGFLEALLAGVPWNEAAAALRAGSTAEASSRSGAHASPSPTSDVVPAVSTIGELGRGAS